MFFLSKFLGIKKEHKSEYQKLEIKSLDNTWHDKDEVLLHAVFQILVDFVEEEVGSEVVLHTLSVNASQARKSWEEIKTLYLWWTKKRPFRVDPLDDKNLKRPDIEFQNVKGTKYSQIKPYDKDEYADYELAKKAHNNLIMFWKQEDQENLQRVINIRDFLWI